MSTKVTLGGTRLGAGNRMKEYIPGTGRSSHNLSRLWKSTIPPGILVPCFKELVLPDDTYKIDIDAKIYTLPTQGPMFGSFKFQVDFFYAPFRLYNGALHNNALGIGAEMENVEFTQIQFAFIKQVEDKTFYLDHGWDTKDFSASSLNHYMGYPSLPITDGFQVAGGVEGFGVHYLMYYDIFKNAYANKQEENAYVMYAERPVGTISSIEPVQSTGVRRTGSWKSAFWTANMQPGEDRPAVLLGVKDVIYNASNVQGSKIPLIIKGTDLYPENIVISFVKDLNYEPEDIITAKLTDIAYLGDISVNSDRTEIAVQIIAGLVPGDATYGVITGTPTRAQNTSIYTYIESAQGIESNKTEKIPVMKPFPLKNIDKAREMILSNNTGAAVKIGFGADNPMLLNFLPYSANTDVYPQSNDYVAKTPLVGLVCKTYQADIFNAWLNTESIEKNNQRTRVLIDNGGFNVDSLLMAEKLFNMRNYITIAGGTFKDWRIAMWNSETTGGIESPLYIGGLSSEIYFQEVIDQAGSSNPLGTLAGRGQESDKKGGRVTLKVKEEGMIMGIVSITPRLDYSQGRVWFSELKNMQQLHTPRLDRIGFEDLLSTQAASWASSFSSIPGNKGEIKQGMGKVPAWIWYQTAYNEVHGEFAEENSQNFMVLTRDYEPEFVNGGDGKQIVRIKDWTTYVNPVKYNKIFADASLTAQNFWVQIGFRVTGRRKMSASLIPQA